MGSTTFQRVILLLATGFGSGYLPKVSGTAGTVVGVLLYWLLKDLPPAHYGITLVTLIIFASWAAGKAETCFGRKDSQKIVIDEVAGFLVAMAFVPFSWISVVLAFILFRLFDIWKPFPCRLIERKVPGGWGVVGDDLMAGVYANVVLQAITRGVW